MQDLTPRAQQEVADIAYRHGVSTDAAVTLLRALSNGNGTMAQFQHPELGGSGQWMMGGMTMVGDMFNNALKARVNGLCNDLVRVLSQQPFQPISASAGTSWSMTGAQGSNWWPAHFGVPASTGSQNQVRYAYFPGARRLAIESQGRLTFYDTLDHQIGGVAQQQGSNDSLTFTSQYGLVRLDQLPMLSTDGFPQNDPGPAGSPPYNR